MSNVNRTIHRDSRLYGARNWNEPEPPRVRRQPYRGEPMRALVNVETGERTYTRGGPAQAAPLEYVCAVRRKPYLKREVRDAASEKRLKKLLATALTLKDWRQEESRGDGKWNLRTTAERIAIALENDTPVVGNRCAAVVIPRTAAAWRKRGDDSYAWHLERSTRDQDELEARNNNYRWNKRARRQEGGISARRRRRGW